MAGQRRINTSGLSQVSLMDAGVGVGVGLVGPMVVTRLLDSYAPASIEQARPYFTEIGAVAGVLLAIPLYFWRGMGLATIAAATAIIYGGTHLVGGWLGDVLPATAPVTETATGRLTSGGRVGYLTAGQRRRRVGALMAGQNPAVRARVQGAGY